MNLDALFVGGPWDGDRRPMAGTVEAITIRKKTYIEPGAGERTGEYGATTNGTYYRSAVGYTDGSAVFSWLGWV